MEAALQVHFLLTLLRLLQKFLGGLLPIGLSISVPDTHVVNTVCLILPELPGQKVSLLFRDLWRSVPCVCDATEPSWLGFRPLYGATLVDEGVNAHVQGGEILASQVYDPVTELIMTCRD